MISIELLGTHVIPELKRRGASNTSGAVDIAIRRGEQRVEATS